MSDDIDRAQQRDEEDRERALVAMRARIAASNASVNTSLDGLCIDCEEPIEPARLAALARKTSRCRDCAGVFEHRQRGYR